MASGFREAFRQLLRPVTDLWRIRAGETLQEFDTLLATWWMGMLTIALKRDRRSSELYVVLTATRPQVWLGYTLTAAEFESFADNVERLRATLREDMPAATGSAGRASGGGWFSGGLVQALDTMTHGGWGKIVLRLSRPSGEPLVVLVFGPNREAPVQLSGEEYEDFAGGVKLIAEQMR